MSNLNQLFSNAVPATPQPIRLMDGKVTVYKRPQSAQWQCRFKLSNSKWHSASTGTDELLARCYGTYLSMSENNEKATQMRDDLQTHINLKG